MEILLLCGPHAIAGLLLVAMTDYCGVIDTCLALEGVVMAHAFVPPVVMLGGALSIWYSVHCILYSGQGILQICMFHSNFDSVVEIS